MQLVVRSSRLVVLLLLILVSKAAAAPDLIPSPDPWQSGFQESAWTLADFTNLDFTESTTPSTQHVAAARSSATKSAPAPATAGFGGTGLNRRLAVWCIVGALIVVTVLLAWLIVMLWRSGLGTTPALVPLSATGGAGFGPGAAGSAEERLEARARILTAEALADPQVRTLREQMASELAEFAKQSLVQGIYSQRSQLMEIQQRAQQELAELEARLGALHLPLQERLRAYESRIAELEGALETRDEEMRNMIRTTLLLVRQRMELEKTTEPNVNRYN